MVVSDIAMDQVLGLPRKSADPGDDRFDDGGWLFRYERVTGAGVMIYVARPLAELLFNFVHHRTGLERIESRLQIEQRYDAARPPLRLPGRTSCRELCLIHLRMPAFQPYACVATGREKSDVEVLEPLRIGQFGSPALPYPASESPSPLLKPAG